MALAYDYGAHDESPQDLEELEIAVLYAEGADGYTAITCAKRNELKQKAERAGLASAGVSGVLGVSAIGAAAFGPPGVGVAGVLGIGSAAFGVFSAGFYQLASTVGGMSCT
jgi:hypothetical protein